MRVSHSCIIERMFKMTREEKIMNTVRYCQANGCEILAEFAEGFFDMPFLSEDDLDKKLNHLWEEVEKTKKRQRELRANYAYAFH